MKNRWYENNIVIAAAVILCFPLGLLMMWRYAYSWKLWIKIAVTSVIVGGLSVFALNLSPAAYRITVNPSVVYLEPDMIKLIDVRIFPENANPSNIKYISSDKSIARAEKGKIIGVSPGYAEIHIEDIKSGIKSDTVRVTVLKSIASELSSSEAAGSTEDSKNESVSTASPAGATAVYISKSGTKYHTSDCSSLGSSKTEISLEEAMASGKTPCKRCNP